MLKKRLIVCLLLKNGQLVKSTGFNEFQVIGNPKIAIQYFNAWAADEIVFLDISREKDYVSIMREDQNYKTLESFSAIVEECAKICFVPLSAGGGVRSLDDMRTLFRSGADKAVINTKAIESPEFITEAAEAFGSQAVVVSIDVKVNANGEHEVYSHFGSTPTGMTPIVWAQKVESLGAGEIFLTSIDRDGTLQGYDLSLIKSVSDAVRIPVVACGGVGKWPDLIEGANTGASAVAAANIFHFTEQSTRAAKKVMAEGGVDVRL